MEGREVSSDGKVDHLSSCGLTSESLPGAESVGFVPSGFNEKFLLEDLDSYLDDLSSRLIVSRMVSDSVVKGIANAVAEEASKEVGSKDSEIQALKEMLFRSESDGSRCRGCRSPLGEGAPEGSTSEGKMEWLDQSISTSDVRLVSKKQLQMLKNEIKHFQNMGVGGANACSSIFDEGSILEILTRMSSRVDMLNLALEALYERSSEHYCPHKELLCEQQWKWDLEKEVHNIAVEHFIEDKRREFRMRLCEEEYFCQNQRKYWFKKSKELSRLREELFAISTSVLGPELESREIFEERKPASKKNNSSRKVLARHLSPCSSEAHENGDIASDRPKKPSMEVDMALLTHLSKEEYLLKKELTKEELISYYMTEMAKMSRNHESALHEKTEEVFKIKRELLRARDSSPFRKDKEFEILRKKIPEFISRLDNIIEIEDNDGQLIVEDHDLVCNLKDQVSRQLAENQWLKGLLAEERKEVKRLSSRISDAVTQISHHTSTELKFLDQTRKLRRALEDTKIEAVLLDEIVGIIFRNLVNSFRNILENFQTEVDFDHDIHLMVLEESIRHTTSIAYAALQRHGEEEKYLRTQLCRKDEALSSEVTKTANLEDKIGSLARLMQEKERIAEDSTVMLGQQRENYELSLQELNLLRMQKEELETRLLLNELEMDTLKGRLEDAGSQVCRYETEMQKADQKLKLAQDGLKELEKQKVILEKVSHEEKFKASSAIVERDLAGNKMKALALQTVGLSKSLEEFESKMLQRVQRNESRLEKLKNLCNPVTHTVHGLRREVSQYKHNMEIKLSNLQKAEDEVDLLGDEVEALLSVLAKVYITLDHYSHVLQHYPGVMEILKLVRTELEGSVKPYR